MAAGYGVKRFFNWLEGRKHKMHVRVFLSYYRAYKECPACSGARLKPEAFLWRLGINRFKNAGLNKFCHPEFTLSKEQFDAMAGLTVHDLEMMPLSKCAEFFNQVKLPKPVDEATELVLAEIRSRLGVPG